MIFFLDQLFSSNTNTQEVEFIPRKSRHCNRVLIHTGALRVRLWCRHRSAAVSLLSLPQNDVHRLQPGRDVRFCDFWRIRFEHVRLGGFNVGHGRSQALPQAQQIVDAVRCELPVLPGAQRKKRNHPVMALIISPVLF